MPSKQIYQLKASTIIEVLVALIIIVTIFTLSWRVLFTSNDSIDAYHKINSQAIIEKIIHDIKSGDEVLNVKNKNYTTQITRKPYPLFEGLEEVKIYILQENDTLSSTIHLVKTSTKE